MMTSSKTGFTCAKAFNIRTKFLISCYSKTCKSSWTDYDKIIPHWFIPNRIRCWRVSRQGSFTVLPAQRKATVPVHKLRSVFFWRSLYHPANGGSLKLIYFPRRESPGPQILHDFIHSSVDSGHFTKFPATFSSMAHNICYFVSVLPTDTLYFKKNAFVTCT